MRSGARDLGGARKHSRGRRGVVHRMIRNRGRPDDACAWVRARLVSVVLAGAVLRLLYDVVVLHRLQLGIDASWYYLEGGVIRREHAFADPAVFATSGPRPWRGHRSIRRSSPWCSRSWATRYALRNSPASRPAA